MARSQYIQHMIRPGSWSPAGFLTAVVVILVDLYFVGQQSPNRDNVGVRLTKSPATSRRTIATAYLFAAAFSAYVVMSYQDQYFDDVGKLGLRHKKDMPQSVFPWFYEEYLDRMPQMFQMMHLRSWAGEAATSKPAWASFIWLSQQYFSGLIAFAFFLLTQSHIRRLKWFTMLAFIWVAMTSLSCAHSLLLAFILLTPPLSDMKWFDVEVLHIAVGGVSLAHHIATGMMMLAINSPLFQRQLLITTALPLVLPLLQWIVPKVHNHHRRLISISEAQSKVFLTTGLLSLVLHWITTWFMFYGASVVNAEDLSYRIFVNRSDVHDRFRLGLVQFLEHDPSVAAMCCDVMLTLLLLLTWIPVSTVSLWGMIKCSMNPWLETGQRTVWDNRLDLGAALPRSNQPRADEPRANEPRANVPRANVPEAYVPMREPAIWRMVLAVGFWVLGGLGWVVPAILGAGTRVLDP